MSGSSSKKESYKESRKFQVCNPSTGKPVVGVEYNTHLESSDIAQAQKVENECYARQMEAVKNFVSLCSDIGIENGSGQMSITKFRYSPQSTMLSKSDYKF